MSQTTRNTQTPGTQQTSPPAKTEIGTLVAKSKLKYNAKPYVPPTYNANTQPEYQELTRSVQAAASELAGVDKSRNAPLAKLLGPLQSDTQAFGPTQFMQHDRKQKFDDPLAVLTERANTLRRDIATAIQKGPKAARTITCSSLPGEALVGTVMTLKELGPRAVPALTPPTLFLLRQRGNVVNEIALTAAGRADFEVFCDEDEDNLPAMCPCSVLVKLPRRPIPTPSTPEVEYGTAVTLQMLGFGSDCADFTLEPADGLVEVGKSPNLRIVAPAVPGQFEGNELSLTHPVRPKARKLEIKTSNRKLRTGATLQTAWFSPTLEVGDGAISFVEPANGLLLATGTVPVTLNVAASGNYAAATSNTVTITVAKGTPRITWTPPDLAVVTDTVDASLNATILPATLQPELRFIPAAGTTWPKPGCVYIRARFAGDDNFEAVTVEAKQVVVRNRMEKRGATDMLNGTAWNPPGPGTVGGAALQDWNSDAGKVKTLGQQIVKGVADKTLKDIEKYLDALKLDSMTATGQPKITVRKKRNGGQLMWSFSNGLQVRVKDEGDKHTFACAVDVEMVRTKGEFTEHVDDTCFKIMTNGSPGARGPWGSEMNRPVGVSAPDWEDYKNGSCRATHIVCPKVPPVIIWALTADAVLKRNTPRRDLMTVSCLGEVELLYCVGSDINEVSANDFINFRFPRTGAVNLYVKAVANDRYTGLIDKRTVTVEI